MKSNTLSTALKNNRAFWYKPITIALSSIMLFYVCYFIGGFLAGPFLAYLPNQNMRLLVLLAVITIVLFGLISIAKNILGFTWRTIGLTVPRLKYIGLAVPAFIGYFMVSMLLTYAAQMLISSFNVEQAQDIGFTKVGTNLEIIAAFISLVVLTPIFEEVIFRGVLFKGLRKRLPFWAGAIITSVIFAVAHGQWNVAVDTFALSLVLCYLVEKSGSILPAILLHALKNSLAFVLLFIVNIS